MNPCPKHPDRQFVPNDTSYTKGCPACLYETYPRLAPSTIEMRKEQENGARYATESLMLVYGFGEKEAEEWISDNRNLFSWTHGPS